NWVNTGNSNAPSSRAGHTAVWTGSEMIVWGGARCNSFLATCLLNTGGRYVPGIDSWIATSTANAPEGRTSHTAVWTDNEMIVWGGESSSGNLNSGGRYNPSTDSWTPTSTTNPPEVRSFHTGVWSGAEMIVWGGYGNISDLNTGGRYNPSTDSW